MMKNIFVGATLLLAAIVGTNTAMAQNQSCNNCQPKNCAISNCKIPANQNCDTVCAPCGPQKGCSAFDGLNLTDQQKEQLASLRKNTSRDFNRKDQLAKIKTILTPEQYQQFLENAFVNGAQDNRGPRRFGHPQRAQKIEKARRIEKSDKK